MIFGIGTDIAKVSRFEKWVRNSEILVRFFNPCEVILVKDEELEKKMHFLCEHYAARFAAKEAFAEYLNDASLDSAQIYFVNQIVEFIVHNGMMTDFSVLQQTPFTDQGSVVEIFTDLNVWMGIRKVIESINDNATAA